MAGRARQPARRPRRSHLGTSEYRIHGTNDPTTIGKFVSSGCIRLTNEDVADLFSRVDVGTKVVVLSKNAPHLEASRTIVGSVAARPAMAPGRPTTVAAFAFEPPGDEPFDLIVVLRIEPTSLMFSVVVSLGGGEHGSRDQAEPGDQAGWR